MDPRITEDLFKMLANLNDENATSEFAFALAATDEQDPATLVWLAACALARADMVARRDSL